MPYPNFHAARVKSPGDFQNIVVLKKLPNGVMIYGGKLKGETTSTAQAYRFPKDKFDAAQAKAWLKEHDIKVMLFEPAGKATDAEDLLRFDAAKIKGTVEDTPEGYIKADAVVTRTGVFLYVNKDGTVRRELRHPDHVFKSDSLASLKMIPITNGHPKAKEVNATTAKELSVGHTGENIRPDGRWIMAPLVVTDAAAIEDIKNGKKELSLGYSIDRVPESGSYKGQAYDCVQTNIRYNHLAIVERARAGAMARLNLDEDDGVMVLNIDGSDDVDPDLDFFSEGTEGDYNTDFSHIINDNHLLNRKEGRNMAKLRIDGIEYEASQEVINAYDKRGVDIDNLTHTITEKDTELDKSQAKIDEHAATIADLQAKTSDEAIQAAVVGRLKLVDVARKVLDEDALKKVDTMSNDDIKKAVITKKNDGIDLEGKSVDYINARFDAIVDALPAEDPNKGGSKVADQKKKMEDGDGNKGRQDGEPDQDASREKMVDEMQNAWKGEKKE